MLDPSVIELIAGDDTSWETGALPSPRWHGRTDGLSAPWVLAADGYPARQGSAGTPLGVPARALENLVVTAAWLREDFWRDRRVVLAGHSGFKGAVTQDQIEVYCGAQLLRCQRVRSR